MLLLTNMFKCTNIDWDDEGSGTYLPETILIVGAPDDTGFEAISIFLSESYGFSNYGFTLSVTNMVDCSEVVHFEVYQ